MFSNATWRAIGEHVQPNQIIRIADIATFPISEKRATTGEIVRKSGFNQGILPVSPATIWRWVRDDKFPKPFKIGSVTAWYARDVDAFIARCAGGAA